MTVTAFTGTRPTMPGEQSSPLRPAGQFRRWFTYIGDFLNTMSPGSASSYDTNWVDVPYENGFKEMYAPLQVRRVGRSVHYRGDVMPSAVGAKFEPGAEIVIARVDVDLLIPRSGSDTRSVIAANGSLSANAYVSVIGEIRVQVPSELSWLALKGLSGYPV